MIVPGRYASIDIGTNSTLLLIADVAADGSISPVIQRQRVTRAGENLRQTGRIGTEGIRRTAGALAAYREELEDYSLTAPVQVAGTAVFRRAGNGQETARTLAETAGMPVRIISGEEEASLSYLAAHTGLEIPAARTLLVDCGGGSTELVTGDTRAVAEAVSISVGAVVLTEEYFEADPPDEAAWTVLGDALAETLASSRLPAADPEASILVGTAGTATSLAAMDLGLAEYDAGLVHGHVMTAERVSGLLDMLNGLNLAARKQVAGLPADRADIILAGTAVILTVMHRYGFTSITVSDRGLRFGLVLAQAMNS